MGFSQHLQANVSEVPVIMLCRQYAGSKFLGSGGKCLQKNPKEGSPEPQIKPRSLSPSFPSNLLSSLHSAYISWATASVVKFTYMLSLSRIHTYFHFKLDATPDFFQEISASKLGQETVTANVFRGFLHWNPFQLL